MTLCRFRYILPLPLFVGDADLSLDGRQADVRRPAADDVDSLARLMLDAYAGTIDDDGESFEDACDEVARYLGTRPLLDRSAAIVDESGYSAACLVAAQDDSRAAHISYIMTRAADKRRGLARSLLHAVLTGLKRAGYRRVTATITEGNLASEELFRSLGFARDGE